VVGRHCLGLAVIFHIETEVYRLWNEIGDGLQFDDVLQVARWYMFRQKPLEAWTLTERTVGGLPYMQVRQ
jgi:hypothetical protein